MQRLDRNTLYWMGVTLVVFPILVLLGLLMRAVQAEAATGLQALFYPAMTLHGLGMAGLWFVASLAAANRVLMRYIEPSAAVNRVALLGTLVGVVLLIAATLIGGFAPGWYFLYPLPLHGTWPTWSTIAFLVALAVLGVAWLLWSLDLLRAIAKKYTLRHALAWHYIGGASEPVVPPAIVISTVSLIVCVACLVAAVLVLLGFLGDFVLGAPADALLMKNLTFFFGHVLVNLSLYLAVAVVYDVLPEYAGRPWKTNKIVAISWNCVLVIVLFAYAHHLYMDFVQPVSLHYIGQIASYSSAIPAAVVTIFGALLLVYHSRMRWNLTSLFMYLGLIGWAIGGVGAVIDSTIAVNFKLHNTLWVPAHFHTYMLLGLVPMVLGYFYHACQEAAPQQESAGLHRLLFWLFALGSAGFLLMFYFSGADSVPRRFALYPELIESGSSLALIGLISASVALLGFLIYLWETGRRWVKALAG
ncbi:MAG: cbb3-type cytochrome c oxidase subunit I [Gammaproteobacteria bacterium]|nr:cbb3-type cytochrome c oxidase subunit I [Gammaproteobacteria bacterium]